MSSESYGFSRAEVINERPTVSIHDAHGLWLKVVAEEDGNFRIFVYQSPEHILASGPHMTKKQARFLKAWLEVQTK
jgi:hypothetical protein